MSSDSNGTPELRFTLEVPDGTSAASAYGLRSIFLLRCIRRCAWIWAYCRVAITIETYWVTSVAAMHLYATPAAVAQETRAAAGAAVCERMHSRAAQLCRLRSCVQSHRDSQMLTEEVMMIQLCVVLFRLCRPGHTIRVHLTTACTSNTIY